jgi:glycosyltransferase involved in cell wall biosynthesis
MSVYHKEVSRNLDRCLGSLANQTLPADEIIIVKDGTLPSELEETLLSWQGRLPLKIIGYAENKGLAYALDCGLKHCSNELIARMDSDDICLLDRFEKQLTVFKNNPDFAVVGGIVIEFSDSPEDIISYRIVPENHADIVKFAKLRNPFTHPSVMFRKSVIINVGSYDISYKGCEDYELWFRVLKSGYIAYNIPEPIIYFRAGEQLIEHRSEKKSYHCYIRLKKQMRDQKFINWLDYQISVVTQTVFYCSPLSVKKLIYKLLRKKKVKAFP